MSISGCNPERPVENANWQGKLKDSIATRHLHFIMFNKPPVFFFWFFWFFFYINIFVSWNDSHDETLFLIQILLWKIIIRMVPVSQAFLVWFPAAAICATIQRKGLNPIVFILQWWRRFDLMWMWPSSSTCLISFNPVIVNNLGEYRSFLSFGLSESIDDW